MITEIQQKSFEASIRTKKQSARGNTLPPWLVQKLKYKRRIKENLQTLESELRKRNEIAIHLTLCTEPDEPINLAWSDEKTTSFFDSSASLRARIVHLSNEIKEDKESVKNQQWNEALIDLGNTDINRAPRIFWGKIKRLGGLGRKRGYITPLTYKGKSASSQQDIANLTADYSKDSFQPLDDITFDYRTILKIERELRSVQPKLIQQDTRILQEATDLPEDLGQHNSFLNSKDFGTFKTAHTPTPTVHQKEQQNLPEGTEYKTRKETLPPANNPNLKVDENWDEMTFHNSPEGRQWYTEVKKNLLQKGTKRSYTCHKKESTRA